MPVLDEQDRPSSEQAEQLALDEAINLSKALEDSECDEELEMLLPVINLVNSEEQLEIDTKLAIAASLQIEEENDLAQDTTTRDVAGAQASAGPSREEASREEEVKRIPKAKPSLLASALTFGEQLEVVFSAPAFNGIAKLGATSTIPKLLGEGIKSFMSPEQRAVVERLDAETARNNRSENNLAEVVALQGEKSKLPSSSHGATKATATETVIEASPNNNIPTTSGGNAGARASAGPSREEKLEDHFVGILKKTCNFILGSNNGDKLIDASEAGGGMPAGRQPHTLATATRSTPLSPEEEEVLIVTALSLETKEKEDLEEALKESLEFNNSRENQRDSSTIDEIDELSEDAEPTTSSDHESWTIVDNDQQEFGVYNVPVGIYTAEPDLNAYDALYIAQQETLITPLAGAANSNSEHLSDGK